MTGSFHVAEWPPSSSTSWQLSEFPSFLRLNILSQNTPHFIYPFIPWGSLRLLLLLGYCECCCYKNRCINPLLRSYFQFFEIIPRSGTARSYSDSVLNCLRNCHCAFHSGGPISHSHQPRTGFHFCTSLPTPAVCFSNSSHSNRCEASWTLELRTRESISSASVGAAGGEARCRWQGCLLLRRVGKACLQWEKGEVPTASAQAVQLGSGHQVLPWFDSDETLQGPDYKFTFLVEFELGLFHLSPWVSNINILVEQFLKNLFCFFFLRSLLRSSRDVNSIHI